ncbi:MAG: hypothetical protein WB786_08360 [Thermoplasmata archaeon]
MGPRRKRRLRDTPIWVLVTIAVAVGVIVPQGVFAAANYITDQTTITIDTMAWAFTYAPGVSGYLPICGFGGEGFGNCPYRAQPGLDYTSSVFISGYFAGKNVNLSAPSPFHLISTNPNLPALVTSSGLLISVDLQLPKTAGEYSFTGNVTFD